MKKSTYPAMGLVAVFAGMFLALAASPAEAQTAEPTVTCTETTTWGQDGEIYERNNVRLGGGFKKKGECKVWATDVLKARAKARGPGVYEDGLFCKEVTYETNKCTVTAAPVVTPPVVPPNPTQPPVVVAQPATNPPVTSMSPGLGKLPPNPRISAGSGIFQVSFFGGQVPQNSNDGTGDFRNRCAPSHFAFDDSIVYPNQPGKSHMHVFFGNTLSNANSTDESIRSTGNSTCRAGIGNRSSYWVPAIINTQTGFPVTPDESDIYYKSAYRGVDRNKIVPMPAGLKMIAGDPKNASDQWIGSSPYVWKCHNNGAIQSTTIPDCPAGDQLEMSLSFGQCWDGKNLDSPDHKSHMAYASSSTNGCPSTHPVALPELSFHILRPISYAGETRNWRLSSDTYDGPAGYSAHGDFRNGWDKGLTDMWTANCVAAGKDCASHMLGNGATMY